MKVFTIRNERPGDWEAVETLTRRAFYNQYIPGCMEHYLVHIMRGHEDFIPELDFVLELDGKVIGNIMYTKAELTDEEGNKNSDSPVMSIDEGKAREFDDSLEKMEKRWMPSQEEFYIMSQSFLE